MFCPVYWRILLSLMSGVLLGRCGIILYWLLYGLCHVALLVIARVLAGEILFWVRNYVPKYGIPYSESCGLPSINLLCFVVVCGSLMSGNVIAIYEQYYLFFSK